MSNYIKAEWELINIDSDFKGYSDFSLVTETSESVYMLDNFTYRNNDSVYDLDTRMSNYNHSVNSDFWDFYYSDMQDYLNEINKDNYFSIIHYKGKKFYIIENYFLKYETYNHYTYLNPQNKKKKEVLKNLIEALEDSLLDQEIKSIINNELNIGAYSDSCNVANYDYTKLNFNTDLLSRLYADLYEVSNEILERVNYNNCFLNDTWNKCLYTEVNKAYKSLLHDNMIIKINNLKKHYAVLDYNLAIA